MLFGFLLFEKMGQRNCIKFWVKNLTKYAWTFEMLTVTLVESIMSRTQVKLWLTGLRMAEKMLMTMLALASRAQNIEAMKKMILDNRQIVADDVGILFGSYQAILTDVLDTKPAAAKIVPKLLSFEQKQRRLEIAQEMLTTLHDDLLKKARTLLKGSRQ